MVLIVKSKSYVIFALVFLGVSDGRGTTNKKMNMKHFSKKNIQFSIFVLVGNSIIIISVDCYFIVRF